jgi:hypothetical protein
VGGDEGAQLVLERVVVGVDELGHAARVQRAVAVDLRGQRPRALVVRAVRHGPGTLGTPPDLS